MFKRSLSRAAWVAAVLLPVSEISYRTIQTGEFFGIPLTERPPRPVVGGPCFDEHPVDDSVAAALAITVAIESAGGFEDDVDLDASSTESDEESPQIETRR